MDDFQELGSTEEEAHELILESLKIGVDKNARNWKFAKGVLKNWINQAVTNIDLAEANDKAFYSKHQNTIPEVKDDGLPF